jgi:predicted XRE-type DNA-binding protein
MPKSPSSLLRTELRDKINERLEQLALRREEAATLLGLAPAQVSRLRSGNDVFTLDRLVDAAAALGISVRMHATRPYTPR